jgi:dnd system-associated protein 4
MSEDLRLVDVAKVVLEDIGRPARIEEIYALIVAGDLYQFNTPTPAHVLRTTIRRHTANIRRVDSRAESYFHMVSNEVYALKGPQLDSETPQRPALGTRRIYRASDKEEIIAALTSPKVGAFREIWRLLLFASQLGVKNRRREPLQSFESGKGIDQSTFGNCSAWPGIVHLIALVETDSPDVLAGTLAAEDTRLSAFQEYANAGLSILAEFFSERTVDMDGLLALIEMQKAQSPLEPDLDFTI